MGPKPRLCVDGAGSTLSGERLAGPSPEVAREVLCYRCSPQAAQPGGKNNQLGASVSSHIKSKSPQISTSRPLPCEWAWSAHIRAFPAVHRPATFRGALLSPVKRPAQSLSYNRSRCRFGNQRKHQFLTAGLAVGAEAGP